MITIVLMLLTVILMLSILSLTHYPMDEPMDRPTAYAFISILVSLIALGFMAGIYDVYSLNEVADEGRNELVCDSPQGSGQRQVRPLVPTQGWSGVQANHSDRTTR